VREPLSSLDGFDGELFNRIDEYRSGMLAAAADLQRRAAQTRAFGQLLTGDLIAQARQAVESIDVRNQAPALSAVIPDIPRTS
jgi:hypothetical protein